MNKQAENRRAFYEKLISLIDEFDKLELQYMDHVLMEAIQYWETGVKK